LDNNSKDLQDLIKIIQQFLQNRLKLSLHEHKVIIRKLNQGIDFLGYIVLPHYRILRTKTKRRMLKRINAKNQPSYLGLLKHCSGFQLIQKIDKMINE
jgi:hypothetical protein